MVGASATAAVATAATLSISSLGASLGVSASKAASSATSTKSASAATAISIMMGAQRFATSSGLRANVSAAYRGASASTSWAYGDLGNREPVCCEASCEKEIEEVRADFVCTALKRMMLTLLIVAIVTGMLHALVHILWKHTVNRRWYQLRQWRMVDLRSAQFVPFPSMFVFPGLLLMVTSAFITGMTGRAATVLLHTDCQDSACLDCRMHAWAAVLVILLYTYFSFATLVNFNRRHRAVTWQTSEDNSISQELCECCRAICGLPRPRPRRPQIDPTGGQSPHKHASPIDRARGHFERPEADVLEPGRTERVLAAPMNIRPRLAGDFLDAYGYSILLRSGGMSALAASFEMIVLTAQLLVALVNGIGAGLQLTPGTTAAAIQMSAVLSVQACTALVISLTKSAADPLQGMAVAVQFSLEGCQTMMLLLHALSPTPRLERASMLFALGALFVPIILQGYDTFIQLSRVGAEGFSFKRLLIFITSLLLMIPRLVMRLLGIQVAEHSALDGVDEIAEHAGLDVAKLAERSHDQDLENKRMRSKSLSAGWSVEFGSTRVGVEPVEGLEKHSDEQPDMETSGMGSLRVRLERFDRSRCSSRNSASTRKARPSLLWLIRREREIHAGGVATTTTQGESASTTAETPPAQHGQDPKPVKRTVGLNVDPD